MRTDNVRTRRALALLIAVGLAFPMGAAAQDEGPPPSDDGQEDPTVAEVERLSEQGAEFFHANRYKEAIAVFDRAYQLNPVANLLYNIALCYDRMGDLTSARAYYERFILAPDADADVRASALTRMKDIEIEQRRKATPPLGNGGGGISGNGDGQNNGNGGNKGDQNKKRDDGRPWLITGLVSIGLGVASIGTGAVFGTLALDDVDTFDASRNELVKLQARENAQDKALLADILYGVGGAAVIAGGVFIILDALDSGAEQPAPTGESRLRPWIGPGEVGAVFELPLGGP